MNKISQQSTNLLLALAYLSIVVFFVNDIVYDFSGHEIDSYFVVELFNTALAMFVLFYQIRKIYVYKKPYTKPKINSKLCKAKWHNISTTN